MARTDIVRLHPGPSGETIKTRAAFSVKTLDGERHSGSVLQHPTFLVQSLNQFVIGLSEFVHALIG